MVVMPLVMAKVAGVVFQGQGPIPPQEMVQHPELFDHGPKIGQISSCFVSRSRPL